MSLDQPAPTAEELEVAFAPGRPLQVGIEEEVMLLDPETLDLAPIAPRWSTRRPPAPR